MCLTFTFVRVMLASLCAAAAYSSNWNTHFSSFSRMAISSFSLTNAGGRAAPPPPLRRAGVVSATTAAVAGAEVLLRPAAVAPGPYAKNMTRSWRLAAPPMTARRRARGLTSSAAPQYVVLRIDVFELECDYDAVTVSDVDTGAVYFRGGCARARVIVRATSAGGLSLQLESDGSVTRRGIEFSYTLVDAPPAAGLANVSASCPAAGGGDLCAGNGKCTPGGACVCDAGWSGEDCSAPTFCAPGVAASAAAVAHACGALSNVIVVAPPPLGDDLDGSGAATSGLPGARVPKPFATLHRALAAAGPASVILLFPGVYTGDCGTALGAGAVLVLVSARGRDETVFDCAGEADTQRVIVSSGATVNVTGVALQGGVHVVGGAARLEGCTLSLGRTPVLGGGLEAAGGARVVLVDTLVTRNAALWGAGIHVSGGAAVTLAGSSSVEDNSAPGGGGGGAFLSSGGTLVGGSFARNSGGTGGNLWVSTATVVGATFSAGLADVAGGGAFIAASSSPSLTRVHITGGSAPDGGGAYFDTGSAPTLRAFVVEAATAAGGGGSGGHGGCVFLAAGARLVGAALASDVSVSGGAAAGGAGGCVYCAGDCVVANASLVGCSAAGGGGVGVAPGAAAVFAGRITVTMCAVTGNGGGVGVGARGRITVNGSVTVSGCSATRGGALALAGNASMTVVVGRGGAGRLESSVAAAAGGGASLDDGAMLSGVLVVNCSSAGGRGGGVSAARAVLLVGVRVQSCTAAWGGGLAVSAGGAVRASNVQLVGCIASSGGGGAHVAADAALSGASVQGCHAGTDGGGADCVGCAAVVNCSFYACSAGGSGGGVAVSGGGHRGVSLARLTVTRCTASAGGAGLKVQGATGVTLTSSNVTLCVAAIGHGGGAEIVDSVVWHDEGCTFEGCAASRGGGIALRNASFQFAASAALSGAGRAWVLIVAPLSRARVIGCVAATAGGCVSVEGGGTLGDVDARGCVAAGGGCVYADGGTAAVVRVVCDGCAATGAYGGGGIGATSGAVVTAADTLLRNCSAVAGGGGGAALTAGAALVGVGNLEIVNCSSSVGARGGGGAWLSPGALRGAVLVHGCRGADGGGVLTDGAGPSSVVGVRVSQCTADRRGGGVAALGTAGQLQIIDCTLLGNAAAVGPSGGADTSSVESGGGGLFVVDGADVIVTRGNITDNVAPVGGGAWSSPPAIV